MSAPLQRRAFLERTALSAVAIAAYPAASAAASDANAIWVSPQGDDGAPGTATAPLATPVAARDLARARRRADPRRPIDIILRGGTYHLTAPLLIEAQDSGLRNARTTWRAESGESVVLSGGRRLEPRWTRHTPNVLRTSVPPGLTFDGLFVDGERATLARYPNADPRIAIYNGYAADAIAPQRVARWKNPVGGYLHALHAEKWGSLDYRITGVRTDGSLVFEGGWQTNRPASAHPLYRYVENIFEELDAPGEWFLDGATSTLYYYPAAELDLAGAHIAISGLRHVVELRGTARAPVRFVSFRGLTIRHTSRTFMETRETLLRSDWAIYRGGAVLFAGTEDCALEDAWIDQPGGNAVFVDGYNRRLTIRGCRIDRAGASSIVFAGRVDAVRDPMANVADDRPPDVLDLTPGPRSPDYPGSCLVEDCLLTNNGRVEKQSAGVTIDIASRITIRHTTISGSPRAGINIGDGCFGGHEVDACDVFDTVLETGDHGSFNSWGRDRFWTLDHDALNARVARYPQLPYLDAVEPNRLHDSRWRCDHGWDIDLDDGSSNYRIYNNVCLAGGIKLREGYGRHVTNNILLGHGFDFHAWPAGDGAIVERNILPPGLYGTALMYAPPWGAAIDDNLVHVPETHSSAALALQAQSGRDAHSLTGDARFIDPASGDYRVRAGSAARGLGFANFPMDRFGVRRPDLRKLAGAPRLPGRPSLSGSKRSSDLRVMWYGISLRDIRDEREMSAYGLSSTNGAVVDTIPTGHPFAVAGLRVGDVIVRINARVVCRAADVSDDPQTVGATTFTVDVFRSQHETTLTFHPPANEPRP